MQVIDMMMAMSAAVFLTALATAVAVAAVIWSGKVMNDAESSRPGRPSMSPRIEDAYDGIDKTLPFRANTATSLMDKAA